MILAVLCLFLGLLCEAYCVNAPVVFENEFGFKFAKYSTQDSEYLVLRNDYEGNLEMFIGELNMGSNNVAFEPAYLIQGGNKVTQTERLSAVPDSVSSYYLVDKFFDLYHSSIDGIYNKIETSDDIADVTVDPISGNLAFGLLKNPDMGDNGEHEIAIWNDVQEADFEFLCGAVTDISAGGPNCFWAANAYTNSSIIRWESDNPLSEAVSSDVCSLDNYEVMDLFEGYDPVFFQVLDVQSIDCDSVYILAEDESISYVYHYDYVNDEISKLEDDEIIRIIPPGSELPAARPVLYGPDKTFISSYVQDDGEALLMIQNDDENGASFTFTYRGNLELGIIDDPVIFEINELRQYERNVLFPNRICNAPNSLDTYYLLHSNKKSVYYSSTSLDPFMGDPNKNYRGGAQPSRNIEDISVDPGTGQLAFALFSDLNSNGEHLVGKFNQQTQDFDELCGSMTTLSAGGPNCFWGISGGTLTRYYENAYADIEDSMCSVQLNYLKETQLDDLGQINDIQAIDCYSAYVSYADGEVWFYSVYEENTFEMSMEELHYVRSVDFDLSKLYPTKPAVVLGGEFTEYYIDESNLLLVTIENEPSMVVRYESSDFQDDLSLLVNNEVDFQITYHKYGVNYAKGFSSNRIFTAADSPDSYYLIDTVNDLYYFTTKMEGFMGSNSNYVPVPTTQNLRTVTLDPKTGDLAFAMIMNYDQDEGYMLGKYNEGTKDFDVICDRMQTICAGGKSCFWGLKPGTTNDLFRTLFGSNDVPGECTAWQIRVSPFDDIGQPTSLKAVNCDIVLVTLDMYDGSGEQVWVYNSEYRTLTQKLSDDQVYNVDVKKITHLPLERPLINVGGGYRFVEHYREGHDFVGFIDDDEGSTMMYSGLMNLGQLHFLSSRELIKHECAFATPISLSKYYSIPVVSSWSTSTVSLVDTSDDLEVISFDSSAVLEDHDAFKLQKLYIDEETNDYVLGVFKPNSPIVNGDDNFGAIWVEEKEKFVPICEGRDTAHLDHYHANRKECFFGIGDGKLFRDVTPQDAHSPNCDSHTNINNGVYTYRESGVTFVDVIAGYDCASAFVVSSVGDVYFRDFELNIFEKLETNDYYRLLLSSAPVVFKRVADHIDQSGNPVDVFYFLDVAPEDFTVFFNGEYEDQIRTLSVDHLLLDKDNFFGRLVPYLEQTTPIRRAQRSVNPVSRDHFYFTTQGGTVCEFREDWGGHHYVSDILMDQVGIDPFTSNLAFGFSKDTASQFNDHGISWWNDVEKEFDVVCGTVNEAASVGGMDCLWEINKDVSMFADTHCFFRYQIRGEDRDLSDCTHMNMDIQYFDDRSKVPIDIKAVDCNSAYVLTSDGEVILHTHDDSPDIILDSNDYFVIVDFSDEVIEFDRFNYCSDNVNDNNMVFFDGDGFYCVTRDEIEEVYETLLPYLYHHPSEEFRPSNILDITDSTYSKNGFGTPGVSYADSESTYYNVQNKGPSDWGAPIYTNIQSVGEEIWIKYLIIYAFNGCGPQLQIDSELFDLSFIQSVCDLGVHWGDFEHLTFAIDKSKYLEDFVIDVKRVYISYHHLGKWFNYDELMWEGESGLISNGLSHLSVFVAKGSHAFYPKPESWVTYLDSREEGPISIPFKLPMLEFCHIRITYFCWICGWKFWSGDSWCCKSKDFPYPCGIGIKTVAEKEIRMRMQDNTPISKAQGIKWVPSDIVWITVEGKPTPWLDENGKEWMLASFKGRFGKTYNGVLIDQILGEIVGRLVMCFAVNPAAIANPAMIPMTLKCFIDKILAGTPYLGDIIDTINGLFGDIAKFFGMDDEFDYIMSKINDLFFKLIEAIINEIDGNFMSDLKEKAEAHKKGITNIGNKDWWSLNGKWDGDLLEWIDVP